jgi:hypothetical protein
MNLINNKLFVSAFVILSVIGLLLIAKQCDDSSKVTSPIPKPEGLSKSLIKEIDEMREQKWDKTVYYRIKSSIESYYATKQIDDEQKKDLSKLLLTNYLLKLKETTEEFCENSDDMNIWNQLYAEISKFASNSEIATTITLLNDFNTFRQTALSAESYGKTEKFDNSKSSQYQTTLMSLISKNHISLNPRLKDEFESAAKALSLVQGLDYRFSNTNLDYCDCNSAFGKNTYYKEECTRIKNNGKID